MANPEVKGNYGLKISHDRTVLAVRELRRRFAKAAAQTKSPEPKSPPENQPQAKS